MLKCRQGVLYPVLFIFLLIVIVPIVYLVLNPFWDQGHLSYRCLKGLILSARQLHLLKTSIFLAASATCLALFLGIPYAVLLERVSIPARSFFAVAYLIPVLIPPYIQAIVWDSLFSNAHFSFGISPFWAASISLALSYFPYITLLAIGGLKGIDAGCEEAGLIHRGKWPTLARVTLPMTAPHIVTGALFVFIFSIIDFGIPDIFRLRVYPVEIFIQFSGLYDEKAAMILALPILIIMALLILLQVMYMKGKSYIGFSKAVVQRPFWTSWRARLLAIAFVVSVLFFSAFIPIAVLTRQVGSFELLANVLHTSWYDLFYSLVLAFLGGLIMAIMAFFIAYFLERMSEGKWKILWEYLTQLPFAIPAILLGIALIKLWNQPFSAWLYQTPLMVLLGYIAHYIPFSIRTMASSLKQVNLQLEEAASLATHNWMRIMGHILLPLTRGGILTAFFIGFVLSLGDLGVTLLVIPPGPSTIPVKIYNFMHYGAEDKVAALSLTLVVLQLIFAAGIWGLYRVIGPVYEKRR